MSEEPTPPKSDTGPLIDPNREPNTSQRILVEKNGEMVPIDDLKLSEKERAEILREAGGPTVPAGENRSPMAWLGVKGRDMEWDPELIKAFRDRKLRPNKHGILDVKQIQKEQEFNETEDKKLKNNPSESEE